MSRRPRWKLPDRMIDCCWKGATNWRRKSSTERSGTAGRLNLPIGRQFEKEEERNETKSYFHQVSDGFTINVRVIEMGELRQMVDDVNGIVAEEANWTGRWSPGLACWSPEPRGGVKVSSAGNPTELYTIGLVYTVWTTADVQLFLRSF